METPNYEKFELETEAFTARGAIEKIDKEKIGKRDIYYFLEDEIGNFHPLSYTQYSKWKNRNGRRIRLTGRQIKILQTIFDLKQENVKLTPFYLSKLLKIHLSSLQGNIKALNKMGFVNLIEMPKAIYKRGNYKAKRGRITNIPVPEEYSKGDGIYG